MRNVTKADRKARQITHPRLIPRRQLVPAADELLALAAAGLVIQSTAGSTKLRIADKQDWTTNVEVAISAAHHG